MGEPPSTASARILPVDAATRQVLRPSGVIVAFARPGDDGRPAEPLEDERWLAMDLLEKPDRWAKIDVDGVVTLTLGNIEPGPLGRRGLPRPWTEGWPVRVEVRARGYLPTHTDWLEVPTPDAEPHRVELSHAPTLDGRVIDEDGAPVDHAEVELIRPLTNTKELCVRARFGVLYRDDHHVMSHGWTDTTGRFSLPFTEDATLRLRIRADGRTPVVSDPVGLEVRRSPPPLSLVLPIGDSGIEGVVRDFDGAPARAAPVVVCRADGFAQSVRADDEGRYRLHVPPGRYRVNRGDVEAAALWLGMAPIVAGEGLAPKASPIDPAQFTVEVSTGAFTSWDLDARQPRDASLIVHVLAEDQDPAAYPVYLWRLDTGLDLSAWPVHRSGSFHGEPPATFPDLPAGRYEVLVGREQTEVDLIAGKMTELEVHVRDATVEGRIVDADGTGVVARLELEELATHGEGRTTTEESDTDGWFEFHLVRPGKCVLRAYVEHGGQETLVHDAPLSLPTNGPHEVTIRLDTSPPDEA